MDDDFIPGDGSFDRFYNLHLKYPNSFLTCVDVPSLLGNGVFYNASMLDKRYLTDMHKVVPLLLSDIWLSFWMCYAHIDIKTMVPPQERTLIQEATLESLNQEYGDGLMMQKFQDLLIREYPDEYEVAKAFAGEGAPWVKRKKRSFIYRALRRVYREIKKNQKK